MGERRRQDHLREVQRGRVLHREQVRQLPERLGAAEQGQDELQQVQDVRGGAKDDVCVLIDGAEYVRELPRRQMAECDQLLRVRRVRGGQGECRGIGDRGGVVRSVRGGEVWWAGVLPA